jgi:hypothetical protein
MRFRKKDEAEMGFAMGLSSFYTPNIFVQGFKNQFNHSSDKRGCIEKIQYIQHFKGRIRIEKGS